MVMWLLLKDHLIYLVKKPQDYSYNIFLLLFQVQHIRKKLQKDGEIWNNYSEFTFVLLLKQDFYLL